MQRKFNINTELALQIADDTLNKNQELSHNTTPQSGSSGTPDSATSATTSTYSNYDSPNSETSDITIPFYESEETSPITSLSPTKRLLNIKISPKLIERRRI